MDYLHGVIFIVLIFPFCSDPLWWDYCSGFPMLQRSLTSAEDECSHLKEMCESSQEELRLLATRYQDQLKEIQELQEKLQVSLVCVEGGGGA